MKWDLYSHMTQKRNFYESQSSLGIQWLEEDGSNLAVPCDRTCILCVLSLLFLPALLLSLHTGIESCKATMIAANPTKSLYIKI